MLGSLVRKVAPSRFRGLRGNALYPALILLALVMLGHRMGLIALSS